ncbi:unnamed protein product [Caenorhabditis brenneri]
MVNVAPQFSLLRLPNDERIEVLSHMDPINLVKVSFLSKRAKEMVISSGFEADSIQVIINGMISIRLSYKYKIPSECFHLSMGNEYDFFKKVKKPTHIYSYEYGYSKAYEWKNDEFEIRDWLDHFHTIFHCKETGIMFEQNSFQYSFDSVYEHFKKPDELLIAIKKYKCGFENFQKWKCKNARTNPHSKRHSFGKSFTLDDLLCCNSKEVSIYEESLSQKDINRFFKLWISGSNRRLEHLSINFFDREVPTLDALVKGIKHVSLPDNHVKFFFPYHRRHRYLVREPSGPPALPQAIPPASHLYKSCVLMAVVPSFPLMRLPIDERRNVLRIMRIFDLTKLSFLSKKAKRLVTSLKLKGGAVNVSIDNQLRIVCTFIGVGRFEYCFPVEHEANVPTVVKQPGLIQLQEPQSDVIHTWTANFTKIRDWSKHFCTIFHHENILIRFSQNACRFDFDWIYEQFKDPAIMILRPTSGNIDYDKRIIQFLNPTTELNVPFNNQRDRLITQNKLVQNLERLSLTINLPRNKFLLNDLLCINSKELNITDAKFDPKDINKFLKLWMKGSNPRLQFFTMQRLRVESLDYDIILQGIRSENTPAEISVLPKIGLPIFGSKDVWREDGTKATIIVHGHAPKSSRPPALPVLLLSHLYKPSAVMAVVPSFPLLRLPVDERQNVLSSMRIFDLVILSFLSKKAKRLVASLNIKAIKLQLVITDCIIIYCEFYSSEDEFECYFPVQHVRGTPTILHQVNQIQFRESFFGEFYSWTENYTMIRDWLQHFCTIFNRKYPALVFSENASLFDFDWIYEQFKNPPVMDYNFDSGSREFDERVLQMLNPILA